MSSDKKTKKIKKPFLKIFSKDPSKLGLNPGRDWGLIMMVFFMMLFGVMGVSFNLFINVYGEEIYMIYTLQGANIKQSTDEISAFREDLTKVLEFYDDKKKTLDSLTLGTGDVIADPSLERWKSVPIKIELIEEEGKDESN